MTTKQRMVRTIRRSYQASIAQRHTRHEGAGLTSHLDIRIGGEGYWARQWRWNLPLFKPVVAHETGALSFSVLEPSDGRDKGRTKPEVLVIA